MHPNPVKEIEQERSHLLLLESHFPAFSSLMLERESLEKKKKEFEKKLKRFSSTFKAPSDSLGEIKILKEQIQLIDQQLDAIEALCGEVTQEKIEEKRRGLFLKVLSFSPSAFTHQKFLWEQLEKLKQVEQTIKSALSLLNELIQHLKEIEITRKRAKGKGLLAYIFGISPNAKIGDYLLRISERIPEEETSLKSIEDDHLEVKQLNKTLEHFKQSCGAVWGFSYLDKTILPYLAQLNQHQLSFISLHQEIQEKKNTLDDELKQWIYHFSTVDLVYK